MYVPAVPDGLTVWKATPANSGAHTDMYEAVQVPSIKLKPATFKRQRLPMGTICNVFQPVESTTEVPETNRRKILI
jgi:hypothetical protein